MIRSRLGLRRGISVGVCLLFGGGWGMGQPCIYDWSPGMFEFPGPGVDSGVAAMAKYDDGDGEKLYVAGWFVSAAGVRLNRIARLGDAGFEPLGSGLDSGARTLCVFNDGTGSALFVGGFFTSAGGAAASHVAKWKDGTWSALGLGTNDFVQDMAVFDDGSGPALFVGGMFTTADGEPVSGIARWDGLAWSPVGGGLDGFVYDLLNYDDGTGLALYAVGSFKLGGANSFAVARWDGVAWSRVGTLGGSSGYALGLFKNGSQLKLAASMNILNAPLQVWSGTSWSGLGACPIDPAWTIGMFDFGGGPQLCAAGMGGGTGSPVPLARWTGAAWEPVAGGPDADYFASLQEIVQVSADASDGLFIGGFYQTAGGEPVNNISRWQNGTSHAVGLTVPAHGLNSDVYSLAIFDDGAGPAVYAAGRFNSAGTVRVNHIGRWSGSAWSALDTGMNDTVRALRACDLGDGEKLYAGGDFTLAGSAAANHIAVWDGASWAPLGSGLNGWVEALAVMDDGTGPALFAGGGFTASGTTAMSGVARWNGAEWQPMGAGFTGTLGNSVHALCVYDDGQGPRLYATGAFTKSGSTVVSRIARWNGIAWEALGNGVGGGGFHEYGNTLVAGDDGNGPALFVGGRLSGTGGVQGNGVFKWNGAWSSLGGGMTSTNAVMALAFFDDGGGSKLYVGGGFLKEDGDPGDCIARWDGQHWDDAGTSLNSTVYAMLPTASDGKPAMFVGGAFTLAGDRPAAFLAKWTCRYVTGDLNCDGTINQFDIQGFITALTDAAAYAGAYPDCDIRTADANRDGTVNQFDIQAFVELLLP